MVDVLDYTLAIGGHTLALSVLAASVWRGCARRYLYLNLYAVALVAFDALRYVFLNSYGFKLKQYFYAFYGTDAVLVVFLYLLFLSVFDIVFSRSPLSSHVRL